MKKAAARTADSSASEPHRPVARSFPWGARSRKLSMKSMARLRGNSPPRQPKELKRTSDDWNEMNSISRWRILRSGCDNNSLLPQVLFRQSIRFALIGTSCKYKKFVHCPTRTTSQQEGEDDKKRQLPLLVDSRNLGGRFQRQLLGNSKHRSRLSSYMHLIRYRPGSIQKLGERNFVRS